MVRLHALDRKLLRDVVRLKAQAVAIALVLACGVAVFLTGFGMYRALEASRTEYYERQRFAEIFASLTRAPRALGPEIAAIDGVWAVDLRVGGQAVLELPGRARAAVGRVLSLPESGRPALNLPLLVAGRLPERPGEVAVNAPFAEANGFVPGDSFTANLDGRRRTLTITGAVLSPEFIYTLPPGALMPDPAGYGVLWLPLAEAEAAFDLTGAFNEVSLRLSRSADPQEVIDRLDDLLAPYGGLGAYDRSKQISHAFIDAEIQSLRAMSMVLPPIFFGIAAFLVNMVLGRIIALERSEIGLLKALGYRNSEVGLHYLMLAGLITALGVGLGWAVGGWMSRGLAGIYARFYDFPELIQTSSLDAYALSGLIGLAAGVAGALRAAIAAARLAPAVAMQPPVPPQFHRGLADRLWAALRLTQPSRMILRGIARWPLRAAMTSLGLAMGVSVLVASNFFQTAINEIVETSFFRANRQDATLVLTHARPLSAVDEARRLPGVLAAEPQFDQPATLRHGPREVRTAISTRPPDADLSRIIDETGRALAMPDDGLMLSDRLAEQLDARPGDLIEAEFLDGRRETHALRVSGIVTQYFGVGAYAAPGSIAALNRSAPEVTAINVQVDAARLDDFHAALKQMPGLASTVMLDDVRVSFQETLKENVAITTAVYVIVAVLITVGVAYNGARIQLSERARELASLRILGFTRAEVSYILIGETLLLAIVAQPLGWLIGAAIAWAVVQGFDSDLYRVPLSLSAAGFARASLVALAAVTVAVLVVRRRLDSFDLVSVMKTRE